jgi:hypothetical protein
VHFFGISAEPSLDLASVIREKIVAGNRLSDVKRTFIEDSSVTNKAHIDWPTSMSQNDAVHAYSERRTIISHNNSEARTALQFRLFKS